VKTKTSVDACLVTSLTP